MFSALGNDQVEKNKTKKQHQEKKKSIQDSEFHMLAQSNGILDENSHEMSIEMHERPDRSSSRYGVGRK